MNLINFSKINIWGYFKKNTVIALLFLACGFYLAVLAYKNSKLDLVPHDSYIYKSDIEKTEPFKAMATELKLTKAQKESLEKQLQERNLSTCQHLAQKKMTQ
jgi:hypothetical protein